MFCIVLYCIASFYSIAVGSINQAIHVATNTHFNIHKNLCFLYNHNITMPNNKKKRSSKKRRDGGTNSAKKDTKEIIRDRIQNIFERSTIEIAEDLEQRFRNTWPPKKLILSLPRSKQQSGAYGKVSRTFNAGLALTQRATNVPGLSRWHLVLEKMVEALEIIYKNENVQYVFLETTGLDHRSLLCSIVCMIGQMYQRMSLYDYVKPWAKAAIAANPKYFKGYSQLATGTIHLDDDWEEGLKLCKIAYEKGKNDVGHEKDFSMVKNRLASLEKIMHSPSKHERTMLMREYICDNQGTAFRFWQDMGIPRPSKTCELCYSPGESKCSKCKVVYYCSRRCQKLDYAEHKHVCVEPAKENLLEIIEKPNFPPEELLTNELFWDQLNKMSKIQNITVLMACANNCNIKAVKRALMEGGDANEKSQMMQEYPIHCAALRNEPENAVDIVRTLIQHGACPNVTRGDGVHLLAICRQRARWIDDQDPSGANSMFRLQHQMKGLMSGMMGVHDGADTDDKENGNATDSLERVERRESAELVQLVTTAIRQHKLCNCCKARKKMKGNDAHLRVGNLTDEFLKRTGMSGRDYE